jgi:hypothetical protein
MLKDRLAKLDSTDAACEFRAGAQRRAEIAAAQ